MAVIKFPIIMIPFSFVGLAIFFVVVAAILDKKVGGLPRWLLKLLVWASIVCCYGFCAFIPFGIFAGLLHMRVWLAIVLAVPLGLPFYTCWEGCMKMNALVFS
jgi:hypothetical protein